MQRYCKICGTYVEAEGHTHPEKACDACHIVKKLDAFPYHSSSLDEHRHTCEECISQGETVSQTFREEQRRKQRLQEGQHKAQEQAQRETRNILFTAYGYKWRKEQVLVDDGFLGDPDLVEKWILYAPTGEAIEVEDALQEICLLCQPKPGHESVQWAKEILSRPNVLVLDTETTGFRETDEIIDIALVGIDGQVRLNRLVQCQQDDIPPEAKAVHHISKLMLRDAPTFPRLWPYLIDLLSTNEIIIYNAEYDVRMLRQTAKRYNLELPGITVHCLMKQFAAYVGQPSAHNEGYRNLSLSTACFHFGIEQTPTHRALADARAALQVVCKLAAI